MASKSSQDVGDGSSAYQAGGDLTVINKPGITLEDVLRITEYVVRKELEQYSEQARKEVDRRLVEFQSDFLARISSCGAHIFEAFADPGVQATVADAQMAYVRSGRKEVKKALIDLVIARCASDCGGLEQAVLEQSVQIVSKISPEGLAALAASFVLTRSTTTGILEPRELTKSFKKNIGPFIDRVPIARSHYEHLVAIGCISRDAAPEDNLSLIIRRQYAGVFQKGVDFETLPPNVRDLMVQRDNDKHEPLVMRCIHDESKFQLRASGMTDLAQLLSDDSSGVRTQCAILLDGYTFSPDDVRRMLIEDDSDFWAPLFSLWNTSEEFRYMRHTSIGLAIAHCYWSSVTADDAPLSVWISE